MPFHFSINTSYFRIKQNYKLSQLKKLLINIVNVKKNRDVHPANMKTWKNFKNINKQFLVLFNEIKAQNVLWSKFLTIYFISYINEICYLAYSFFFVPTGLGWKKTFFAFFAAQFMFSLILITVECSRIVEKNCTIHRKSQQLALQLQKVMPFSVGEMLKIDRLAMDYKNIRRVSFKLLNNYRIDSKFFQMARKFKYKKQT